MKERIIIPVVTDYNEDEELKIEFDDEYRIVTLKLNDKEICRGDWDDNFNDRMSRMVEIWK